MYDEEKELINNFPNELILGCHYLLRDLDHGRISTFVESYIPVKVRFIDFNSLVYKKRIKPKDDFSNLLAHVVLQDCYYFLQELGLIKDFKYEVINNYDVDLYFKDEAKKIPTFCAYTINSKVFNVLYPYIRNKSLDYINKEGLQEAEYESLDIIYDWGRYDSDMIETYFELRHNPDFTKIEYKNKKYELSYKQGKIIKALNESTFPLSGRNLLVDILESTALNPKLSELFKYNKSVYKDLIIRKGKNTKEKHLYDLIWK